MSDFPTPGGESSRKLCFRAMPRIIIRAWLKGTLSMRWSLASVMGSLRGSGDSCQGVRPRPVIPRAAVDAVARGGGVEIQGGFNGDLQHPGFARGQQAGMNGRGAEAGVGSVDVGPPQRPPGV